MLVIFPSVVLVPTNPCAVFDNGVVGLASPLPSIQHQTHITQDLEETWAPWKQKSCGDFFDQVAELENLIPANEDTFSDLNPTLLESVQASSPWSGSTGSEDKELTDDSERDGNFSQESRHDTTNTCKKILDKRVRNNQASKKFRQLRKGRHKALFDQLQALESENNELSILMEQIKSEIKHLKAVLPEQDKRSIP